MVDPAAAARPLRALWGALASGGVAALVALTALAATQPAPAMAAHADAAFYACALYGTATLVAAFGVLLRMRSRLAEAPSDASALRTVRSHGVAALAAVESSAVLAGVVVFLTGNVFAVAYGVPLVAFAVLTWPTAARVAGWLSLRRR